MAGRSGLQLGELPEETRILPLQAVCQPPRGSRLSRQARENSTQLAQAIEYGPIRELVSATRHC
jgi:hypothetical protein